jgi:hypothetical protein
MPYYEVQITATKCVCVKADDESEAEDAAADSVIGDWNRAEGEVQGEYDENDPKQREFIEEYKANDDYIEA